MEQYFKEGEEVILRSKELPQYNGEYVVHAVLQKGDTVTCRLTGLVFPMHPDYSIGYLLDQPIPDGRTVFGREVIWAQSALRKKYRPSEDSLEGIIGEINSRLVHDE